ncbi:hypothetical protein PRIPAC_93921 [Pristionchus pacificus]|uniref:Acetyltransferase n=1 Tax=Pristionchus pacificus TaxID=54126 RepID=A0A2A6BPL3_PRIPA|nr:hypothetical protein PRIPAC_93921 [Pristionchus pacificus]|eukprot:PDM67723.1 Acetyltransferase [Pristionchus pacificus]
MIMKLVALVDRQDLNDECISLLNEEWPRSYTTRAHSQQKSCRGLGKILMNMVESKAKELKFSKIYLSTHDQVPFYRSCGYETCAPILHSTTATSVFPILAKLAPAPVAKPTVSQPSNGTVVSPSTVPPPPPPPPAPKATVSKGDTDECIEYMCKTIA